MVSVSGHGVALSQKTLPKVFVKKGQTAVLGVDGRMCVHLSPGVYPLSQEAIPELSGAVPADSTAFPVEIYFLNEKASLSMYFGTSNRPAVIVDPVCQERYRLQVFGRFSLSLSLSLSQLSTSLLERLSDFDAVLDHCRKLINQNLSAYVQWTVDECNMDVSVFSSAVLTSRIRHYFGDALAQYGLTLTTFLLDTIWINDDDLVHCMDILHLLAEQNTIGEKVKTLISQDTRCRFCMSCGKELPPEALFCPYCGVPCGRRN